MLGPTDPNRLMAMSAGIDPSGAHGGPVITTASNRVGMTGKLNWATMPEALLKQGVSWKAYNDPTGILGLGVLSYFKNYTNPFSLTGLELIAQGPDAELPRRLRERRQERQAAERLVDRPALAECEHPAAPRSGRVPGPADPGHPRREPRRLGADVFIVNYDENGGFFDHVPPPAAPAGTAGEYLSGTLPSAAGGIACRSASASAPRPWSSRRSAPAATSTRARSTTRARCA